MPTRQMISGPVTTVQRARKLRREMTLPEVKLWTVLRRRPGGFKFRRQHPAGPYVLDFYCAAVRLAIEVDGWAHDTGAAAHRDAARSAFLRAQHVATLRIPAAAVLDDVEPVVTRIVQVCGETAAHWPSRSGGKVARAAPPSCAWSPSPEPKIAVG